MNKEKTERNQLILKLLEEGKTYTEVMDIFGLKSKGNIWQIVAREERRKKAVLSYPQEENLQRT